MKEKERRTYLRLPFIIGKPIKIHLSSLKKETWGIIGNISLGGMGLLTFVEVPVDTKLNLQFDLNNFKIDNLPGEVIWTKEEEGTYQIGIRFTHLNSKLKKRLQRMSDDFTNCQNRIILGIKDVCFKKCSYYPFCDNERKE
jgi:c-di-GMP-binding flagellar brake protein YcgR